MAYRVAKDFEFKNDRAPINLDKSGVVRGDISKPIMKIRVLINLKSPLSTPSLKLLICRPRLSALRGRILQIFNQNSTIQPPAERAAAREIPRFFLGVERPSSRTMERGLSRFIEPV